MRSARPPTIAVLTAVLAGLALAATHVVRVRRALLAERAARRLADASHHRDLDAFTRRLHAAISAHQALTDADRALDAALAAHFDDPHPEGGPA